MRAVADLKPSDPRKRKLPLPAFATAAKVAATAATSAPMANTAGAAAASAALPKKRVDPRIKQRMLKNLSMNEVRHLNFTYAMRMMI